MASADGDKKKHTHKNNTIRLTNRTDTDEDKCKMRRFELYLALHLFLKNINNDCIIYFPLVLTDTKWQIFFVILWILWFLQLLYIHVHTLVFSHSQSDIFLLVLWHVLILLSHGSCAVQTIMNYSGPGFQKHLKARMCLGIRALVWCIENERRVSQHLSILCWLYTVFIKTYFTFIGFGISIVFCTTLPSIPF